MANLKIAQIATVALALGAGLLGCGQRERTSGPAPAVQASAPAPATASTIPADAPPGIDWFHGSVAAAFDEARTEGKPVLLYWGAKWCPYCHELKGTVFARADFIEKSRLFIPVYLDGDTPGAQQWGDVFHATGYPTVLILRSDRSELERVSGGMDLKQYGEVLDLALGDVRPVQDLLASLVGRTAGSAGAADDPPLSRDDCRRLAYYGWDLDPTMTSQPGERVAVLRRAAEACPPDARVERARLTIVATVAAAAAEQKPLKAGKPPSAQLAALVRQIDSIVSDRSVAAGAVDTLEMLDDSFFTAAKHVVKPASLEQRWTSIMDQVAEDGRYPDMDRLDALDSKLVAIKALDGAIPAPLAAAAEHRIDAVLARPHDVNIQAGDVEAALNILDVLGDTDHAYAIALHEEQTSSTPYYYMSDLADLEEKRGHKDLAIGWLERAYHDSQGAATRFQWGTNYVRGLVRLRPDDDRQIRSAALAVLAELDGPNRIYSRSRMRLEKLDGALREWNRRGQHTATIIVLRQRVQEICAKVPASDPARETCTGFLANA
ncbi:MAG TPA: thioredoxin family protein [Steroidobacteraceae bacterium]|nr:thioredoxin family protein [Steroidobacteraceae bacterium]